MSGARTIRVIHALAGLCLLAAALSCSSGEPEPPLIASDAPRIVVLAPAAAEMLEAIGMQEHVVGAGDFVTGPVIASDVPRVGSHDAPNIEKILSLRAGVVVTSTGDAASASHARLRELGVEVLDLDTSTYDGVFESLNQLGARFDRIGEAQALESAILAGIESVREKTIDAPRRKVLFVVGRDPLYVAGPGSHIDVLIEIAGGVNVAHDALAPYQMVSLESMLERMPEVIIDTSDNRSGALRGNVAGPWGRWKFLPAVNDGRVFWVEPDRLVIPGVRLAEMAHEIGGMVHPEIFGEGDERSP